MAHIWAGLGATGQATFLSNMLFGNGSGGGAGQQGSQVPQLYDASVPNFIKSGNGDNKAPEASNQVPGTVSKIPTNPPITQQGQNPGFGDIYSQQDELRRQLKRQGGSLW